MIPAEAFRFGEAAIRRGWCTLAEVVDALGGIRAALTKGEVPPAIEDVLVAEGLLSDERAAAILSELRLESTGELIGGYRILARLGSGGMGTVYKAQHLQMDRPVALKVLPAAEGEDEADVERFLREARAVARLEHPHIVRGFDAGEHRGTRYLAMELLEGRTTLQILRQIGPFPERKALAVVRAVASALDHAWRHGVVHRDVKPSNVFLTDDQRTVLFDFGLAKKIVDDPFSSGAVTAMGTPHYASPEQIRRIPDVDGRSDVYSLGCTWFHLLTGRPPFPGSSTSEIAAKHLKDRFPDPDTGREPTETLNAAGAILRRMCEKDRARRYQDVAALLADLDDLAATLDRDANGAAKSARALVDRLLRREPEPPPPDVPAYGGVPDLLRKIAELQEENARLFCERDLLHHEAAEDEKTIEHLEAENARLACARDLLDIEVTGLRGAMDGLRLRREAQRRARAEGRFRPDTPEGAAPPKPL